MEKYELTKDINVMYVSADSFPEGIDDAFRKLESKLTPSVERMLFGLSWPGKDGKIMYKAAADEKYKGESKNYELDSFTIIKGTYASEFIKDYKKDIAAIGEIFQRLLHHPELDRKGYCLEWYKNDDVLCLVKLAS